MLTTADTEARSFGPADRLTRLLDFATATHSRALAVLVLVSLAAFLPGFFQLPPIDRDEARFAQATKQMVESGDYIDIRFQDDVRYKKPVGIYWLQAGVVKAAEALGLPRARTTIWLYRIPSLVGAIGAVLLTYWAALAFVRRRYAYLAALMMAGSILLGVEARLAKTDAMLLLTVTAAMGSLARAYLGALPPAESGHEQAARAGGAFGTWILPLIFWTALAGGVLLKGPLILLFAGLAAVTLAIADRSARWLLALRPLVGAIWFLVLVLPWFLAITSRAGESFFAESVGHDLLAKVFSSQESHGAPPGYYFLLFWITFWPAAPLAALAAPGIWAARREPAVRFLLAWLVPAWILLELVITKLPHYVLPLYPAVAILVARALQRDRLSAAPWLRRATVWWPAIAVLVPAVAIGGLLVLRHQLGLIAWPFAAAAMISGFIAWRFYDAEGPAPALMRATLAEILIAIAVLGFIAPSLRPLFPSVTLARTLQYIGCDEPLAASAAYHEPSLVFLAGTSIRLTDGTGAAEFLNRGYCRVAFIDQRQERAFAQRAEALGLRYQAGPRIEGINISNGRQLFITVYRSEAAP
jgi:4-amino-4-deoxy-L-arabinose transferase-like glycosyltransferase